MRTVLFVEDNPENQMLVEDIFELDDIPAKLMMVETGEEGLQLAAELQPALILLDVMLPGLSGLETAVILRANPDTQNIPIWGLSALAMAGDSDKAMQAGFDRYITKPLDTKQLASDIKMFLDCSGNSPKPTADMVDI